MTFGGLGVYFWVFWVIFCLLVCFCLVPSPEAPAASERKVVAEAQNHLCLQRPL